MKIMRALLFIALAIALPASYGQPAKWPDKPVRVVVPFAPGGGTDIVARIIAARLFDTFGQQFVIDNRGGAGGLIGMDIVAHANPDGYTLAILSASYSANAALYKLTYDPVNGVAPISLIAAGPLVMMVHPSVPAHSLKEFIELARAKPGTLNFGSSGTGGSIHLAIELFRQLTKTDMQHVPYKGTGPAMTDLLAGHIQFLFAPGPVSLPQVKAGKVRALAVTTPQRSRALPDLPAIAEAVPGFEYVSWHGMLAPAGTPKEIIMRLNQTLHEILKRADVQERLRTDGVEPAHTTPEEFAGRLTREIATWNKVVKVGRIRAE